MSHQWFARTFVFACTILACGPMVLADSAIGQYPIYGFLGTEAELGFPGGEGIEDTKQLLPAPDPTVSSFDREFFPHPVPPQDVLRVNSICEFAFGTPIGGEPLDTFRFTQTGEASATEARDTHGNPAEAHSYTQCLMRLTIDPVGLPLDVPIATLVSESLRALEPFETFLHVEVRETGVGVVLRQESGSGPMSIPLYADRTYVLNFTYDFEVPFRSASTFSLEHSIHIVPEPTTLVLLCPAILGLALRRERRIR